MMLDPERFQYWLSVIADRVNPPRVLAEPTVRQYYAALAGRLTTEQFERAAERVFVECRWWPAPIDFIERARKVDPVDPKLRAASAFDRILLLAIPTGVGRIWNHSDIADKVGPAAWVAFCSVGGAGRLANLTTENEAFVRRDFEGYFLAALDSGQRIADELDARSLADPTTRARRGVVTPTPLYKLLEQVTPRRPGS